MKKRIALCFLLLLFLSAGLVKLAAQEKSAITVKKSEVINGVVVVSFTKAAKAYTLQCNQGAPSCNPLKAGKYQMVELPKNCGMYDCRNVDVYPESTVDPENDKKLGEYCLIEK